MSFVDVVSYWRCPNCNSENELHHGWRSWIRYNELPMEMYTAEKCAQCGKQYYVAESEPDWIEADAKMIISETWCCRRITV